MSVVDRRQFLNLAGLAGAVAVSGLGLARASKTAGRDEGDFYFMQMSDSHWGFEGAANPDAKGTLPKAVNLINELPLQPDFIVFTGDLTHTTDDPAERRRRMAEFRKIVGKLDTKAIWFIPGEHDAALDNGKAYIEMFGPTHYVFDHKGVHFIVLDNVSDPAAQLGQAQLEWLAADLDKQDKDARIVVFAHRPLFDLYPQWDWATRDGAKAVSLLMPHRNVSVFYGHIHQEHHHMTGHIAHHSAKSLIFPQPVAGSQAKRAPVPWDPAHPYAGLGFRDIHAEHKDAAYPMNEFPLVQEQG